MKLWQFLFLFVLLTGQALGQVSAYFNQNQKSSYTDPYRGIQRPGDNLEQIILNEIALAKKTIFVAVQELRLPLIASALVQKKKEGIDVRVVLENNYNNTVLLQTDATSSDQEYEASRLQDLVALVDMNRNGLIEKHELETRDAVYMLKNSGIPVMDDSFDSSKGSGLMHHKFIVIDDKVTVVSSANFTLSDVHGDLLTPASRGNANSLVVVRAMNFAKIFTAEFAQLWGNGVRGNYGHKKTYRGAITTTVRGTKITVQFSPTSQRYNWEESVNGLIANHLSRATKSINAALFVFSDQNISNVMEKRNMAGVEIGVLIEPKFAYREYSELLDLMGLGLLNYKCSYEVDNSPWKKPAKLAGMARLPSGDMLHHKFAVVDKKTVIMGSQNWSDAANFVNDETLIVIQDDKISDLYTQEFERIRKNASLGAPEWLKEQIRKQEIACDNAGMYY